MSPAQHFRRSRLGAFSRVSRHKKKPIPSEAEHRLSSRQKPRRYKGSTGCATTLCCTHVCLESADCFGEQKLSNGSVYLVVVRRTDNAFQCGRRPVLGIVAPGGTGSFFVRPFRAVMTFRAQKAAVLFDGCGRGGSCGAETNVARGADIANQPVRVGPVRARWTLSF